VTEALLDYLPTPLPDLEPVGFLLSDESLGDRVLSELTPKEALYADRILKQTRELLEGTAWDAETLTRNLGCPVKTVQDFRDLGEKKLKISSGYVDLLWDLAGSVETPFDVRTLVLGYGHLYRKADRNGDRVEAAFIQRPGEAYEYLGLGEVQTALDIALRMINPEAFNEPRNLFADLPRVHISTTRLDALIKEEYEILGPRIVAPRMREHIFGRDGHKKPCEACAEALAYRRERLLEDEQSLDTQVFS
jgi:hypothetical protein